MIKSFAFACIAATLFSSVAADRDFFITPESNSVVALGEQLCIQWRAGVNYKEIDPFRGYITFSLVNSNGSGIMYMLVKDIDFMAFEGIKVNIPENIPSGNQYRILAELESCKYGNRAYFSEPFRIVPKGSMTYQSYGISSYTIMENELGFGNCYGSLPDINPFLPPQLDCDEIPDILGFHTAEDMCSFELKFDIRTLAMGIIDIVNVDVENDCQLEREDNNYGMTKMDQQRLKDSIFCLSDTDCYPNEYCDNFQKKRNSSGYWLCQTRE